MATMTFHTAVNMDTAVQWFALVEKSVLTRFVIYDGFHSAAYTGYGFTYDTVDDSIVFVTGTVTGYAGYENGFLVAEYEGIEVPAVLAPASNELLSPFFEFALNGNDTITGSNQSDVLRGFAGKDVLLGGVGPDELYGDGGRDSIHGNGGRDSIHGGNGNDSLYGEGKSDVLTGGRGADRLTGGTQADRFEFLSVNDSRADRMDTIADFADGDRIDLRSIDARPDLAEDQKFKFIGDAEFTKAGQLRFADNILQADINGDGDPDFAVRLIGVDVLSAADMLL